MATSDPPPQEGQQPSTITLQSADGTPYTCEVLDVFELEGRHYAALLTQDPGPDAATAAAQEPRLVVMRLIIEDNGSTFQTIESDDEFARVGAHLRQRAGA